MTFHFCLLNFFVWIDADKVSIFSTPIFSKRVMSSSVLKPKQLCSLRFMSESCWNYEISYFLY